MSGYYFRVYRWYLMLKAGNSKVSFRACVGPLFASFAINNVLPFRVGDILRSFAFNVNLRSNSVHVITSLIYERLFDLLGLLLFLMIAILLFDVNSSLFFNFGFPLILFAFISLVCVIFFPDIFKYFFIKLSYILRFFSKNTQLKFVRNIDNFFCRLKVISSEKILIKISFWTFLVWLAEGLVFLFCALALTTIKTPLAAWFAMPVGTLSTLFPGTPGYVGTFDFFVSRAMNLFGNDFSSTVVYALTVHIVLWLPITVIGGIYLLMNPVNSNKLRKVDYE
jgi:uncharacterized protein (TIRG00374 family)